MFASVWAKIALAVIVALLGVCAWLGLTVQGQRVVIAQAKSAVSALEVQISVQAANNTALLGELNRQNEAIALNQATEKAKRTVALAARDAALAQLTKTEQKYAQLRKTWPQECVAAVSQVRRELNL